MGQTQSKSNLPPVTTIKFELMCQNTFYHTQLQRDRKISELQKKEQGLADLVKNNKTNTNKESISMEASNCIVILNHIKGSNMIMNQMKMLKENSMDIVNFLNRKESINIRQLEPHIQTVIWSTSRLNLQQIKEFSDFISLYLGNNIYQVAEVSPLVDLNLKKLFMSVSASPLEIQDYLEGFCTRQGLSSELIKDMWGGEDFTGANSFNWNQPTPGANMGLPMPPNFPSNPHQQQPNFPTTPNPYVNPGGFQQNAGMGQSPPQQVSPQQYPAPNTNPFGPNGSPSQNNQGGNPFGGGSSNSSSGMNIKGGPMDLNTRLQELRRIGA